MDDSDEFQTDDYEFVIRNLKSRLRSSKECMEILRNEYTSAKDEITNLKKEKQTAADLVFKLNNENILTKKEISNLKIEIKNLLNVIEQTKNELELEKNVKYMKKNSTDECDSNDKLNNEINELKRKNYFLQLDNEKACVYVSDYVVKLKEFEDNLIKERTRFYGLLTDANNEISELKKEKELLKSTNLDCMELDKLKQENQGLNTKCVNLRLNLNRKIASYKEQKERINELTIELKEKETEIEELRELISKNNNQPIPKEIRTVGKRKASQSPNEEPQYDSKNSSKVTKLMDLKF